MEYINININNVNLIILNDIYFLNLNINYDYLHAVIALRSKTNEKIDKIFTNDEINIFKSQFEKYLSQFYINNPGDLYHWFRYFYLYIYKHNYKKIK